MRIRKVLNNNVVVSYNELNQQVIVMGKGLAFHKKEGDEIDTSKIRKTFVLQTKGISDKIAKVLMGTSEIYLNIAAQFYEYAQSKLSYKLDEYLYIALTDHISFAVSRYKKGVELKNPLAWEIRKYYKLEYQLALKCLEVIEKKTDVRLGDDEAATIALHLVNSQLSGENMKTAFRITEIVDTIISIVKYHFKIELDEESVNYERFLTHLRFFAIRLIRNEKPEENADLFFYEQIKANYTESYDCTAKIATYLKNNLNWDLSKDEEIYLTVHINRVTDRQKNEKS
ncbi:transcription antiterminator LicT [Gracilibacillus halophilus YIM-C55.5]|uniref:Transcription antiterminator LicT n=1 Tax=Gracilibacillus halophilus YIM-C55.5 TaxID=1308866 RepID=N4WPU5_9BACI|nr:PRD domain-containing protein [Gracilibacillus halophilus]ENH98132.1 transcription antiterminator LicT [Gracilibacillus halophilus YIM-C55.5]